MDRASNGIAVRSAVRSDLEFVSQDGYLPRSTVRRKIDQGEVLVAEVDGVAAGYLRIEHLWSVQPYIALIRVLEPYRRRGVGRALLTRLENTLRDAGRTALFSSSQADEAAPQAWHRHMGFEECGIIRGINEGGVSEVFFRKPLSTPVAERPRAGARARTGPDLDAYRTVRPEQADAAADRTRDLDSPESVVRALYDLLSGPAERERERDWARFRALALPDARFLICHGWDEEGRHVPGLREWDVDGFIDDARRAYADEGFWEREVAGRTQRFGNLAHRFSSYESRVGSPSSEPVGRGINSIQLVRHGGRWWIASVVWDTETGDQPIPPEYLG